MKFDSKEVLKFLFPEWQVIQTIKQQGFIKKSSKKKLPNEVPISLNAVGYTNTSAPITPLPSEPVTNPTSKKVQDPQNGTAVYNHKDTTRVNNENLSLQFKTIREELGKVMIGQSYYLDQLCLAFKRPYVTGYDKIKPKNVLIILGHQGTGKRYSISHLAELMKERKLLSSKTVYSLDFSLYPTAAEFGVFLSDLYKCLYGHSDIVMFQNFEKGHAGVFSVIQSLVMTGRYTLSSRYMLQNNALVEATNVLMQNSVSEIGANGKFFVFSSIKSEKEVLETFGSKFMDAVGDILQTHVFSEREVKELSHRFLVSMQSKSLANLSLFVTWDDQILSVVSSSYKTVTGVHGLIDFMESQLYKPLSEYKLRNSVPENQSVLLTVVNDALTARINGGDVPLITQMPQMRSKEIEEVKKQLESIVGINSVKEYVLQLEDNLKIQQRREQAGLKSAQLSMHMIFTGNPGTGKTTIARIVAQYLKAVGVLSSGQLREVSRADLVGQYVGHTAKRTNDIIHSALGGVLFIDEAYALCRDKHDIFGLEAIDTLVKGMEDHRDNLVVILAGYQEEMEKFLKINSGLKSRFPNMVHFEDYSSEDMLKIAQFTAESKGYRIAEDCSESLVKLFDKRQIRGRNDSGNGRLVRNVIERAILNQSKRLLGDQTAELDLLIYVDFSFDDNSSFDLEANLTQIIGLENVKDFVRTQYKLLIAQEKRRNAGIQVNTTQSLNMVFTGNPGTGKTTVARIIATMLKDMGLLKSGHLVETDRGGLVAEYVGQTAKKTEEVFRSALGGVLFVDEAYALTSDGNSFGMEAINTLVKLIEDFRGEIVVILAGYQKEMKEFMKANSGLESRFPLKIDFPDYNVDELHQIALRQVASKGFVLAIGTEDLIREQITILHKQSNTHSGNGRMVRNFLEEFIRNQSARIAMQDVPVEEMNLIVPSDLASMNRKPEAFDLEDELSKITGLNEVKDYIRSLSARLKMQSERKKLGLTVDSTQTLHVIFKGNPGTGKTMVARMVAQVLYNLGVIRTQKFVETDRSGLVAGYVGQTALKTKEVVMEAMDGVLFVDEAYSLSQGSGGGGHDFGREAIDTLVKLMDDYRDRLVVILAGYSADMDQFLSMNAGLKSRFPNIIEFADYNIEQLIKISENFFHGMGYELNQTAISKLRQILDMARKEPNFGNGRYVRNLYERAINNQALRLSKDSDLTKEDLIVITDSDLERV